MIERRWRRPGRLASEKRIAEAQAATAIVVASGKCPDCGGGIHRNMSLAGWWQCDRFGAPGFRKDTTGPACNWQGFTS